MNPTLVTSSHKIELFLVSTMISMTECLKCYVGATKTSWLGITSGNMEEKECFNNEVDDYLYNGGFACVKNSGCK